MTCTSFGRSAPPQAQRLADTMAFVLGAPTLLLAARVVVKPLSDAATRLRKPY